jgi:lipopolysaccharide biosynthesis regulator YciM
MQRQGQIEPAKTAVQRALEANPASTRASALLAGLRGSS